MTTSRTISERQFEELRGYESGHNRWVNGGPLKSLVTGGYIAPCAHDRSMFTITPAGQSALSAFRSRYGIR